MTGYIHYISLTPACSPKCKIPSALMPYFTANGKNYRLLGISLRFCLNQEVTVTGWLHTPTQWSSQLYTPLMTFAGDITVLKYTVANGGASQTC